MINCKSVSASLILLFASISFDALADFKPAITYEKTLDTYEVNKDGTHTLVSENINLIETESGITNNGEIDIPYNGSYETVKIIYAYTLQLDGKKVPVPKDGIRTTEDPLDSGTPQFSDTKHKVIIFPHVKVGSRLCYKYEHVAHTVSFKNNFYTSMFFSPNVKWGNYDVFINIDKRLPLYIDSNGVAGGLISTSAKQNHYKFSYSQNHVLPPEKDSVAIYDYAPNFVASTFPDQISLGRYYQSTLAPNVKVTPEIQKLADELTVGINDEKERVRALYNWVKANIRYVAVYLGNGGYEPHPVNTILNNRYGDCKDHAAILESLLKAKGIESSTALINWGESYTLPKYAVVSPQNHAITYVPSLDLYLDSTSKYSPFGTLSFGETGKPTILTALNRIGKTPVMRQKDLAIITDVKFKINDDGSITGSSSALYQGVIESNTRAKRADQLNNDDKNVISEILQSEGETGSGTMTTTDPNETDKPYVATADFNLDPITNFPGPGAMKIPVGVAPGLLSNYSKNKPEKTFSFPYQCISGLIKETYEIEFPATTKITSIPEDISFQKGGYRYISSYRLESNKLQVLRELSHERDNEVCQPSEETFKSELFAVLQKDLRSQIFYE